MIAVRRTCFRLLGRRFQAKRFTALPSIDVSSLVAAAEAGADAVTAEEVAAASALHDACRQVGFFCAANHGIDPSLQRRVLRTSRAFFALPEEVKARYALSGDNPYRGYQRLGINITEGLRDRHEALDVFRELRCGKGRRRAKEGAGSQRYHPLLDTINQLPDDSVAPGFAASLAEYVDVMSGLGRGLMRGVAVGLGLPPRFFAPTVDDVFWIMRVIHYPLAASRSESRGVRDEEGGAAAVGCGRHTDYGNLTMIAADDVHAGLLQVQSAGGTWVTARPPPGTLCCNLGDMLSRWTNGLYQSTPHRVLLPTADSATGRGEPGQGRISVPFFFEVGSSVHSRMIV